VVRRATRSSWARGASASGYSAADADAELPLGDRAEDVACPPFELGVVRDVVGENGAGEVQGPAAVQPLRVERGDLAA